MINKKSSKKKLKNDNYINKLISDHQIDINEFEYKKDKKYKIKPEHYIERVKSSLLLGSYLETIAFRNGDWEFNYFKNVDSLDNGLAFNYRFLYEYFLTGDKQNFNNTKLEFSSSDDTIVLIATLEAILNGGGEENYKKSYLKYLPLLEQDKRISGYSTLDSLKKHKYNTNKNYVIEQDIRMGGNGPSTRTTPIGLIYFKNLDKVIEEAFLASRITHNYYLGYLGGIISALFGAFCQLDINPYDWSKKLLEQQENIIRIINKYDKSNNHGINKYFIAWKKYNTERLSKMEFRKLPIFMDPKMRFKHLLDICDIENTNNKLLAEQGYVYFGASGLLAPMFAYDILLLSNNTFEIDTYQVLLDSQDFQFSSIIFQTVFNFGDNDSISAIVGAWYGAYFMNIKGLNLPLNKLEFYNEIITLTNKINSKHFI